MIELILLISSSTLSIILIFTTINLLRKNEKQEDILAGYLDYLDKISKVIEISDKKLKEIDTQGTFKSDDEVGFFFKSIQQIQNILNDFQLRRLK